MGVSPQRHGRGHVRRGTAKISRFPLRTGLRTHYTDCPHAALSSDLRRSRVVGTSFLSFLPDPHPMTNPHIPAGAAFRTRCSFLAALGLFALPLGAQTAPAVASATMASPIPRATPSSSPSSRCARTKIAAIRPPTPAPVAGSTCRSTSRPRRRPPLRRNFGGLERHRYARIVPLRDERRSG